MLKTIFYISLLVIGCTAAVSSPVIAAVVNIEAYMFNPITVARESPFQRYQFCAAIAFLISIAMCQPRGLGAVNREGRVLFCMWVYVAIAMATSLWAVESAEIAFSHAYNFSKTVLIASLFVLAVNSAKDMSIIRWACIVGVLHAAFMHTEGVDLGWVSVRYDDEAGVLPDTQGMIMVIFTPLIILTAVLGRTKWERWTCWLILPFILNSIVTTYQRAYFVGLMAQCVALLLFLPRRIVARLAPVLAVGLLLFVFVLTPENYWDWMNTISDPTSEGSANSRLLLYQSGWQAFQDFPMGVGYRNFIFVAPDYLPPEYIGDASTKGGHSTWIDVACQTGILGFAAWLGAVGGAIWLMRRIRKGAEPDNLTETETFAMAVELGLYGWLVGGTFHSQHEADPAYWFIAFAVILTRLNHQEKNQQAEQDTVESTAVEPESKEPLLV